jgi:hypothetical protein
MTASTKFTSQEERCHTENSGAVVAIASPDSDLGKPRLPKEVRGIICDHFAQIPRRIHLEFDTFFYNHGDNPRWSEYYRTSPGTASPIQLSI